MARISGEALLLAGAVPFELTALGFGLLTIANRETPLAAFLSLIPTAIGTVVAGGLIARAIFPHLREGSLPQGHRRWVFGRTK